MTRRRGRQLERDQRGSTLAAFCLLMMVLIPLFLGLLQVCLVMHVRNTLSAAAAEGARAAAVAGAVPEDGVRTTRDFILGTLNERFARDVRIDDVSIDGAPGYRVDVTAEMPALGLGGPAVRFTVSGNAIREVEQ